jgi:hypothetical protein
MVAQHATLAMLLRSAYDLDRFVGMPAWAPSERFDIVYDGLAEHTSGAAAGDGADASSPSASSFAHTSSSAMPTCSCLPGRRRPRPLALVCGHQRSSCPRASSGKRRGRRTAVVDRTGLTDSI